MHQYLIFGEVMVIILMKTRMVAQGREKEMRSTSGSFGSGFGNGNQRGYVVLFNRNRG